LLSAVGQNKPIKPATTLLVRAAAIKRESRLRFADTISVCT